MEAAAAAMALEQDAQEQHRQAVGSLSRRATTSSAR